MFYLCTFLTLCMELMFFTFPLKLECKSNCPCDRRAAGLRRQVTVCVCFCVSPPLTVMRNLLGRRPLLENEDLKKNFKRTMMTKMNKCNNHVFFQGKNFSSFWTWLVSGVSLYNSTENDFEIAIAGPPVYRNRSRFVCVSVSFSLTVIRTLYGRRPLLSN